MAEQTKKIPVVSSETTEWMRKNKVEKLDAIYSRPTEAKKAQKFTAFRNKNVIALVIVVFLLIVLAGVSSYYYIQYRKLVKNPNVVAQDEAATLTAKIGKLMILPQGEQPKLATVTDVGKLKDQPFFTDAQNGDKVLIYVQAKKAILYRPATNQIVDVSSLNNSTPDAAANTDTGNQASHAADQPGN